MPVELKQINVSSERMQEMLSRFEPSQIVHRTTVVHRVEIKSHTDDAHDATLWRAKAIVDLYEWMKTSKDYRKTIDLWAAVYLRCGSCHRGFLAWYEECEVGPEDDLLGWLQAAQKIVTEKHWI